MPTIVKTPSGTWKAVIRKTGFPTNIKTFRLKKDADDWARRTEDEMVRGLFIQRGPSERLSFEKAMPRYLAEVTPGVTKPIALWRCAPLYQRTSSVTQRLALSRHSNGLSGS